VIDSGRTFSAKHRIAGRIKVELVVDLVNQRVPLSSTHSVMERGQHALVPNRSVRPLRYGWRLSGGGNPEGHCRQSLVRWFGHHAFIFLRPFAPPVLTGFNATMDALTPAPGSGCLSGLAGIPVSFVAPSVHSASNHPLPSRCAIWCFLSSCLPS